MDRWERRRFDCGALDRVSAYGNAGRSTRGTATAKNFVGAMYETARWANDRKHYSTSATILAKAMKTSAAEINASTRVVYSTTLTAPMIQPLIDVVARYKLIPATYPATELLSSLAAPSS